MKPGRNDPCPCGSGKKYKKCCPGKFGVTSPVSKHPGNEVDPTAVECSQLVTLYSAGHYAEVESRTRLLLERYPESGFGWKMLCAVLHMTGSSAAAKLGPQQKAVALSPEDPEGQNFLGNTLMELGRLAEAEASYRRALQLKPDYVDAQSNLGKVLRELGRLAEAEASNRRALELKPDFVEAHINLGAVLKELGRLAEAEASYRRALELKPDYAGVHYNLANALKDQGQLDEAVASYRRALELDPNIAMAYNNLGLALKDQGQLDDAVASYRRALELDPNNAMAYNNLGLAFDDMCRPAEAETSWRQALQIKPDLTEAFTNLLFHLQTNETTDVRVLFAEHGHYGELFETPLRSQWPRHANSRNPDRPLKIGFVSADLNNHPVANFIEPVLMHLTGHPRLSLHAYYNNTLVDGMTERLRGYLEQWHPIARLSDEMLAQKIREDGIDVLIDLSGHTDKNRLLTFARKPAPVQASWIGYPGTTGLRAMDYYFSDRLFLPPGQFDSQFTEKIVRLPASTPFLPSEYAPPVNALPALANGYVTFGSFNRLNKFSPSVIALWSQVLRSLPGSRVVLGGIQERKQEMLIEWFAQGGIAREQLDFHPRTSMAHYLALHQQVDLCLDTFPYSGGTTTLHALWMGVPTISLAGSTAAGRTSAGILGHVGLEAFVAHDAADFVQKGLSWASQLSLLSIIRTELRDRFARSAMGQPELISAGLERALRIMWQRWCADLPAQSIEVTRQDITDATPEACI